MERHFEEDLKQVNQNLVTMATLALDMINASVKSLVNRDIAIIKDLNQLEKQVNDLQVKIDEQILVLLAKIQPMASDLRFLVAASKINGELERIADQAVNISQSTRFLLKYQPLKYYVIIPLMSEEVIKMVGTSVTAYMQRDVKAAEQVLIADDKIDAYKEGIFRELLTYMMADKSTVPIALSLILISRNLEKIGDHATNIAEEVIFIVQGLDIRHHHNMPQALVETKKESP
jgi:phosphate transport system protein